MVLEAWGQATPVQSSPFNANYMVGKHDLLLNIAIEFERNRPKLGFFGFMQVIRPAARRVYATLPTEPKFLGARTGTLISSNLSHIGCKMKILENGFLFWIM